MYTHEIKKNTLTKAQQAQHIFEEYGHWPKYSGHTKLFYI